MELGCSFPSKSRVELIVTSPLRRAIYTGLHAFGSVFEDQPGRKLIALPSLQELSNFPCDVGSPVSDLQAEVDQANLPVDLSFVEETWTDKVQLRFVKLLPAGLRLIRTDWKIRANRSEDPRPCSKNQALVEGTTRRGDCSCEPWGTPTFSDRRLGGCL